MVPTIARTILYKKPSAQTYMRISLPERSARHQCTVRTVVFVSVPTLRTAAKSCVPSNAAPAARDSSSYVRPGSQARGGER